MNPDTIAYDIRHITTYSYSEPVTLCQNVAHLSPRTCSRQHSARSEITISPEPAVMSERVDYFGNPVSDFTIQEPHRELSVRVQHQVSVAAGPAPDAKSTAAWEGIRDRLREDRTPAWLEASEFEYGSRYSAPASGFAEYARISFAPSRPILEAAFDLTRRIHAEFIYDPRATTLSTPVAEVFASRRGVCQDFAHFQIACLRSLGLAARYVSGYLSTLPPPGRPRLIGADATHAWISLFCGDAGWIDLDPTNNQVPGNRHILVAWGRDYDDVSPLKGVILGGGQHSVKVSVDVTPRGE